MAKRSASGKEKPTAEAGFGKTMVSKGGGFKVGYTSDPEAVPVNKLHSWKLKVETPDGGPVKDASISVEGTMPAHGHGMPTQPQVTRNFGDGSYLVEGMKFSMPGWWVVTFAIEAGEKSDSVVFNLQLQ
ncbi:MAG: FixH family protein [Deltaproteobacteria bacterium]|nr:FixH family protein [Deltaproteobacteria bacterium]